MNPEYVTDVTYVRNFTVELCPSRLRLVAALNGFPQPPAADFDYCELGAAHGDTTATLAAAHPKARFVGVDINPEHVAFANGLASRGGLANIRFLERDFADLGAESLPVFDYIVAHGVLSWVGPEKRRALLAFASAHLKPGGLLYVSYNALPGWAAVEPLRRLIMDRAAAVAGGSLERAREGVAFARLLDEKGAEYFTNNPPAKKMLATLERVTLRYVAHEYLHAHWVPAYFADVAQEMATSDLYFIGQLPLFLNYRDLAIPPSLLPLFKDVSDRITFETLKDFAINEYFRRDVYVKGRTARSEVAVDAYFDATPFGAALGDGPIERDVRLSHYTLRYAGPIYDALIPAIAEGAATVSALAERPELDPFGVPRIRDAVMRLALGGQVSPMQGPTRARGPTEARLSVPLAYNRAILEQPLSTESPIILASPVAGAGMSIPMLQAIAVRLLTEVAPASREAWVKDLLLRQPFRLKVGEAPVEGDQERAVLDEVEQFRARRLGKFLELGILEAGP